MIDPVPVIIVIGLILINGLFVAAEFAIVAIPRAVLDRRANQGERQAILLRRIVTDPIELDRFIATAQIGITVASLGLGMYGEHLLAEWIAGVLEGWGVGDLRWISAHALASFLAILLFTYWHVVVGEMVPKAIALNHPERTTFAVMPTMRLIHGVLLPFVLALNAVGNGALRLFGIRRDEQRGTAYRTPEELELIVRESQAGGLLRNESARVVRELLEFGELTAREVMIPRVRVRGLPLDADAARIRSVLEETPHTRYPVYRDSLDRVVGAIHVRDLVKGGGIDPRSIRPLPFVPESLALDRVLESLHRAGSRMAVVMDEHGGTAGIVTVEDVFEEVVGEVEGPPEVWRVPTGEVHADGGARLEMVGELLGLDLDHDDVDTVSGVVLDGLGRPPVVGDVALHRGVEFEVLAVEGRGVRTVRIDLAPADDEGDEHPRDD